MARSSYVYVVYDMTDVIGTFTVKRECFEKIRELPLAALDYLSVYRFHDGKIRDSGEPLDLGIELKKIPV